MKHLCKSENLKKIMWVIIYTLPIWILLIGTINNASNMNLLTILENLGTSRNIIYNTMHDIFGQNGILELFVNDTMFLYATYYINMKVLHILVDTTTILLDICHNALSKLNKEKEKDI